MLKFLLTSANKYLWISVDKSSLRKRNRSFVDKCGYLPGFIHHLCTEYEPLQELHRAALKKKVDRLSSYPQCLLLDLF